MLHRPIVIELPDDFARVLVQAVHGTGSRQAGVSDRGYIDSVASYQWRRDDRTALDLLEGPKNFTGLRVARRGGGFPGGTAQLEGRKDDQQDYENS